MEHSLVSWFPCRSMPGKLAKSHRFDLLHNGNGRSETGDNRGRVRFFSHHFLGLWPGMMVNHLYFVCISICTSCIYIYMHIHSMYCLKGGNIKHALQEGCFFFRGWDTITINYWHLWVSEAVSSGVSPCSKRGIISSPWGIRPTEPGSCLLVSAGSGVHLLDLETKSSFGMGLGQWIISQLPNATPPPN